MSRKWVEAVWFLFENLPSLLTVAFTAYVLILSQKTSLNEMEVLLWLLGIVGLLATSELVERFRRLKRIEETSTKTLDLVASLAKPDAASILHSRRTNWDREIFHKAQEVFVSGYSLVNFVRGQESFLKEGLISGNHFKLLLLKPDCPATELLDGFMIPHPGELKRDIAHSLKRLERIVSAAGPMKKGRIEIRLLKIVPTFSLYVIDPHRDHGWISVELYPTYDKIELDTGRPHFVIKTPKSYWFKYFLNQFEAIWNDTNYSEPYHAENRL